MTTVGTNTYGVVLSSAVNAGAPSGDICYFFCNDVSRDYNIKDKPQHTANEIDFAVVLDEQHYVVNCRDAIVADNALSTLNSYHALMKGWARGSSSIYFWAKDKSGTYLDFIIVSTTTDYLKCRIVSKITDKLSNKTKAMSFTVEQCNA